MTSGRLFRLLEATMVTLFTLQATRSALAMALSMVHRTLDGNPVESRLAYAHLALLAALAAPWLVPRARTHLPRVLLLSAIGVAAARAAIAVPHLDVQLYASLVLVGLGAIYLTSLIRARAGAVAPALSAAVAMEQLLRAPDTFDPLLRPLTDIPIGDLRLRMPMLVVLCAISACLAGVAVAARRAARYEPYEPANLTAVGGLAVGGWLVLELMVLGNPGVAARWAAVPRGSLVAWMLAATALPLLPGVRRAVGEALDLFDDRLRGWVWLFLMLTMLVLGNRLDGFGAAGALVVAQFMCVMLAWWFVEPPDASETEQVGPSMMVAVAAMVGLTYLYGSTFVYGRVAGVLRGQGLVVILVAAALAALPRLRWREDDPWLASPALLSSLAPAFVAPAVVLGLLLSGAVQPTETPAASASLRVATYNLNHGYDETGRYQLALIARSVEVSQADIVILQEVDAGSPISYGIDQVEYLARHLGMFQIYQPAVEHLHGVAVLSRWPILQGRGQVLPGSPEQTSAVYGRIEPVQGRAVAVIAAHMRPSDEAQRLQQVALVFGLVEEALPLIVGVDLGSPPGDSAYQQFLAADFLDPDTVLGIDRGFTYPASNPGIRHDYVFVRGLIPADSSQVASTATDHRLVVVEVIWP